MSLPKPLEIRPPKWGKIHPWRRLIQVLTSLLFIAAPFMDLLRFDIAGKKLVILRTDFSLLEMGPMLLLVVFGVLVIFAGALIYGRLFCGWFCPQTTLSELAETLFRKIERRRKAKRWRRVLSRIAVTALAAFVAASLVSYLLAPAQRLAPPTAAWIAWGILTTILAANLIFLRHRFCDGVCPYGILQSIVPDERTLRVKLDHDLTKICVKCYSCIRACFMGLDIRRITHDAQCVNCGECLDSINAAHRRLDRPIVTGFRFGDGAQPSAFPRVLQAVGISDFRRLAVVLAIALVGTILAYLIFAPRTLEARVSPLYERTTVSADGIIRNHYDLRLANRTKQALDPTLQVSGLEGLTLEAPRGPIHLAPGERLAETLILRLPRGAHRTGSHPITIRVHDAKRSQSVTLKTRYFVPAPKKKR